MTIENFRPFNLKQAKGGAPVGLRSGKSVRILCFDRIHPTLPIVCLVKSEDGSECMFPFEVNGKSPFYSEEKLVMLPLDCVEDKPVFAYDKIEYSPNHGATWYPLTVGPETTCLKVKNTLYRWPKKKVKKEVWQAKWQDDRTGAVYFRGKKYSSQMDCIADQAEAIMSAARPEHFVRAELISTYEVEE